MTTLTQLPPIHWTFGDVLAKLRHDAGISVPDMAERLDMSERTIRNYENDATVPKRSFVLGWARECGYPHADELLSAWQEARSCGCSDVPLPLDFSGGSDPPSHRDELAA